jgi:WD40 repeat protein
MKRYLFTLVFFLNVVLIPASAQSNLAACETLLETRLNGGMYARVLSNLSVYEQPSASSPLIGSVDAGTQVYVTSAPVCAEDIVWYQAMYRPSEGANDFPFGFIGEGANGNYDLEPVLQSISLPSSRERISSANISSLTQVAQVEFGMIYQSTWSPSGQYWMINSVGANWLYDIGLEASLPLRFTPNPYDTNASHGMATQDSEFVMLGTVSPVSESQQAGFSSFSLLDGSLSESETLLDANYAYVGAVSSDGKIAAAANWDGEIVLYELSTASQLSILNGHSLVGAMQFSPNGQYLVSVGGSGMANTDTTIRVWDVATGTELGMLDKGDEGVPNLVIFTPDSSQIVTKPVGEAHLNFYSPDMQLMNSIELPTTELSALSFSADASLIALATVDGDINTGVYSYILQFYDMSTSGIISTISMPALVKSLAFSPDNTLLSIVYEDPDFWGPNRATLWAVSTP